MKLGKKPPNMSKKGAVVGMVICFVAMIAVASVYTSGRMNRIKENQTQDQVKDEAQVTGTDDIKNPSSNEVAKKDGSESNTTDNEPANPNGTGTTDAEEAKEQETAGGGKSVSFSADESMKWPVGGGVIMGFSMDRTIYFKTLDQYKCNPAMIIDGEEGDKVVAAADGVVLSMTEDSETGKTLVLDMGNEYRAIYGQLDDVQYSAGQYVAQGATLGKIATPSKYYTEEGPNLFFEVTKDGVPVNPTEFLE